MDIKNYSLRDEKSTENGIYSLCLNNTKLESSNDQIFRKNQSDTLSKRLNIFIFFLIPQKEVV